MTNYNFVEQPAKKIKLDNNEKLERKRTYDQVKRKRSWQKNRNWLVHNTGLASKRVLLARCGPALISCPEIDCRLVRPK
jgi:hypothetical protein